MRASVTWIAAAACALLLALAAYPVAGRAATSAATAPDADLARATAPPGGGPSGARFAHGLADWRVLGPGAVSVRAGGAPGRYCAVRDNSTLVSALFTVPASHQMLFVTARAPVGNPRVRVLARSGTRDLLLGTLTPGRTWKTFPLSARGVAGSAIALVLDPVMGRTDALDLAKVGQTGIVAPALTLARGVAERIHRGPGAAQLSLGSGPFSAATTPFRMPLDAVTVSVWARAIVDTQPTFELRAQTGVLGSKTVVGGWQPVRVSARGLRGRLVALSIGSVDASGLQLGLIGTVQRSAHLRLARTPDPKGTILIVRGSPLIARARLRLVVTRVSGRVQQRAVRLGSSGRARVLLRGIGPGARLMLAFAGSEAAAPATVSR